MFRNKLNWLIIFFLLFGTLVRIYNLFNLGSYFDMIVTQYDWGKVHYEIGPFRFWQEYDKTLDYMPGAMYLDWFIYSISKLFGGGQQAFVTVMKVWNWIWDILFCWLAYRFTKQNKTFTAKGRIAFTSLVYALPSIISVTGVWGQIDTFVAMMGIIALLFYFYSDKKLTNKEEFILGNWLIKFQWAFPYLGGIFIGLGYWIKPTAILTLPIIFMLLVQRLDWKGLWKVFIGFILISIPFGLIPVLANPYKLLYIMTLPLFGFGVNNASRDAADLWYLIGLDGYSGTQIINFGFIHITVAHLAFILCGGLIGYFLLRYFNIIQDSKFKIKNNSMSSRARNDSAPVVSSAKESGSSLLQRASSWFQISLKKFFSKEITLFEIILISTLVNYVYFIFYIKMLSRYLMMGILLSALLMALWNRSKRYMSFLIIILATHLAFALNQIYIVNNNVPWINYLNTNILTFNYLPLLSVIYLVSFIFMYKRSLEAVRAPSNLSEPGRNEK